MFLNYKMPEPSHFEQVYTKDSAFVAPNTRISIQPGKGELRLAVTDHVAMTIALFEPDPEWIEFAIDLPVDDWKACRQIFLSYRAAGSRIRVRPALRLGYENGFHDHFSLEEHITTEKAVDFSAEFLIPPRWARQAIRMDLHMFLRPEEGCIAIQELTLTGVR